MTATRDFDALLEEWFATTAPPRAPHGLHAGAMSQAGSARQRGSWLARPQGVIATRTAGASLRFAFVMAAVAVALVGLLVVSGGRRPPPELTVTPAPTGVPSPAAVTIAPTPTATFTRSPIELTLAKEFVRPFTYTIPEGSDLRPAWDGWPAAIAGFVVGPSTPEAQYGVRQGARDARGIVLVALDRPVVHTCHTTGSSRIEIRSGPADFLSDLVAHGGVGLGAVTSTTLDGRPALTTMIQPAKARCPQNDLHGAGEYVLLSAPSRLIVLQVAGTTILVDVWARSEEDLAIWLPAAMGFVDSIHFVD